MIKDIYEQVWDLASTSKESQSTLIEEDFLLPSWLYEEGE